MFPLKTPSSLTLFVLLFLQAWTRLEEKRAAVVFKGDYLQRRLKTSALDLYTSEGSSNFTQGDQIHFGDKAELFKYFISNPKTQETLNSINNMFILTLYYPCDGNVTSSALFLFSYVYTEYGDGDYILTMLCITDSTKKQLPQIITKHQNSLTVPLVSKDTPLYFKSCACRQKTPHLC
ncbi:hypothetical protein ILYODFUR_000728 [Ilyodon furcidens]|uniref:Uncharacterized protein n=1 Tax=Ilyodon furcidens TaxID=33524 RepID=A0ABV0SUL7_9TELE